VNKRFLFYNMATSAQFLNIFNVATRPRILIKSPFLNFAKPT